MPDRVNDRFETVAAAALVTLSQELREDDWLRVLPSGTWKDRGGRGPFHVGGLAEMQAIIDTTKKWAGNTDLMIDFDHQSKPLLDGEFGTRAEAAGWIKALQARADGIYAQIGWNEPGREKIRTGAYRYLSPLFWADKQGKVGLLLNAALVNTPALDLGPIAAALNLKSETIHMDKIATALGLKADASEEVIAAAATALQNTMTALSAKLVLGGDAKPEDIEKAVTALVDDGGKVAVALGLDVSAKPGEIVALAAKLKNTKDDEPDPAEYVPVAAMAEVQKQLTALTATVTTDKAEAKVDEAIKEGKLIPAQRAWAMSLAAKDIGLLEDYLDKAVPLTTQQLADTGAKPAKAAITALSAEQKSVARLQGIAEADYLKTLQAEQETTE